MKAVVRMWLGATLFGCVSMLNSAHAGVIADLTLEEWTAAGGVQLNPPYDATSVLDANLDGVSGSSVNGSGSNHTVGGGGSIDNEINWANWDEPNYFSIEVTPSAGATVDLDNITFSIIRNGTGAPTGLDVWVVAGSYAGGALGTADATNTVPEIGGTGFGTNNKTFDLSGVADQSSLFSIVLGTQGTAGGNLRINDVVINGTVNNPIPEPHTL